MTATIAETGLIDGLSNQEYHSHASLSATGLKILATQTPAHYRHRMDNPEHKGIFDVGTATHSLVLEDDHSKIRALDFADWRTKAAREERDAAYADGMVPLLKKDYLVVKAMRDSVAAHPVARLALTGGKAEQSLFWQHDTGAALRCRPDKLDLESPIGPIVADLKTAASADPRKFGKTAFDLGYHQQDPHYRDGIHAVTGARPDFLFILVEKAPPYLVSVVELDAEAIDLGRAANLRAIHTYNHCRATETWPGYPEADPISLPAWATREA
ncbi:PD-(D/E)XK nuclease-like domain-containing protein [Arthrobacter sp. CP30]